MPMKIPLDSENAQVLKTMAELLSVTPEVLLNDVVRQAILLEFDQHGTEFLAEILSSWVFPDRDSATHAAASLNEYTLRCHLQDLGDDFHCTAKVYAREPR